MSIAKWLSNVQRIASSHANVNPLLDAAAGMIAREIKQNIDRRQNAGSFRVDDAGSLPGEPMIPLAAYTIKRREDEGIFHAHPLKATGEMYNSIGTVRSGKLHRTVGAKGRKNQRKLYAQLGTDHTDVVSSERRREIPPRNPVGYSQVTSVKVKDIFVTGFGGRDRATAKIRIDL